LSPQAQAWLITAGPGASTYALFGHSAIRVQDPVQNLDRVYNYGSFDFDQPNFYTRFVQGKLLYKLSAYPYRYMPPHYAEDNRALFEQRLLLSPADLQVLFNRLETNAQPENAEYLYDFFYDNCATRLRDQLEQTLGSRLQFAELPPEQQERTFRQLITPYIQGRAWLHFGIDLILGPAADAQVDKRLIQFLPDHLATAFGEAQQLDASGTWTALVGDMRQIGPGNIQPIQETNYFPPLALGVLLFVLAVGVTVRDYRRGGRSRWFDSLFWLPPALLGVFYLVFWLGTDHRVAPGNLNLLWANPLLLVLVFVGNGRGRETLRPLAVLLAMPIVLVWLGNSVLPQEFHLAAQWWGAAVFVRLAWFYAGPKPNSSPTVKAPTAAATA